MQIKRTSTAVWVGTGKEGAGTLNSQSTALKETQYVFNSRFADGAGTNPEELIAAAHAGCFSMKLAFNIQAAGMAADEIKTACEVVLEDGTVIESNLHVEAAVPGLDAAKFTELVNDAKVNCPISKLLNCAISVNARLK
jgi:osmotically inducible protein OsmC